MAEIKEFQKSEKPAKKKSKVIFVVSREFSGQQSMQEAFEQLIERQAYDRFEDWLEQKAS
ncbi:MAG: hypothetical protein LUC98_01540 [Lachnospiraceae bacterium]|nr:hypothetical protein [Lachnospiraceae bacterium]